MLQDFTSSVPECLTLPLTLGADMAPSAVCVVEHGSRTVWVGVRGTKTVEDVMADMKFGSLVPLPGYEGLQVSGELCSQLSTRLPIAHSPAVRVGYSALVDQHPL